MSRQRRPQGRRARPRRRDRYLQIPLAAAGIFLLILLLTRTGAADKIEALVGRLARNEALSQTLLALTLPSGGAETPDETAEPPSLPPEADEPAGAPALPVFSAEGVLPFLGQRPLAEEEPVSSLTIHQGRQGGGSIYINNDSGYEISIADTLAREVHIPLGDAGPQVLIMHTHGSEAYTPDPLNSYIATDTDRTTDLNYNMVRVGEHMADILEENGIEVIHSTLLHDYPAYSGSYDRALNAIEAVVEQYPSIQVIIDVHRDAMVSTEGAKYKAVTEIEGKSAAQLMFVTGTDAGGLKHDHWRDNLAFQMRVHQELNTCYPGIMRPIHIRTGRFNQHVRTGSMLLEVGTSGNSLDEALYSAGLFAQTLADVLNSD